MATRTLIADLEPNQVVEGPYAIFNTQLGQTKSGKPYLKCLLGDKSGRTPGRLWNINERIFATLPTDGFVRIEGQSQPYQGEIQIIIHQIEPIEPTDEQLKDLLPTTDNDIEAMLGEVFERLDTVRNMPIRYLLEAYLNDDELMSRFHYAPAAMMLHHAYLGGLLEHTLSVLRLADAVCPLYPDVSRDLVMMGLFIHDLGKCRELTWATGFGYSDEGQLVGHVVQGAVMLEQKAARCAADGRQIPDDLLMVLKHIVVSHHGRPEFGAVKIPATPEALLVSLIDNLDAKMHMAVTAARGVNAEKGQLAGNFTEKIWGLETRLYRPDPTRGDALAPVEADGPTLDQADADAPHPEQAAPADAGQAKLGAVDLGDDDALPEERETGPVDLGDDSAPDPSSATSTTDPAETGAKLFDTQAGASADQPADAAANAEAKPGRPTRR